MCQECFIFFISMHLSHFITRHILKGEDAIYKSDMTKYPPIDQNHIMLCHMVHIPAISSSRCDPNIYNFE